MKYTLMPLLLAMLVAGMVLGSKTSDGQKTLAGQSGPADKHAEIDLIKKMDNDRIQAGVRKDVEAIAPFTADEYVQIDFDGRVMDKETTFRRINLWC